MTDEEFEALLDVIAWTSRSYRPDQYLWHDMTTGRSGMPLTIVRSVCGRPVSVSDSPVSDQGA